MEPELRQALTNIEGKLDALDKRLEKIEDRYTDQVMQTAENKMRIEEVNRDLTEHKDIEEKYGRQFDTRLKELEAKTWKLMLAAAGAGLLGGGGLGSIF